MPWFVIDYRGVIALILLAAGYEVWNWRILRWRRITAKLVSTIEEISAYRNGLRHGRVQVEYEYFFGDRRYVFSRQLPLRAGRSQSEVLTLYIAPDHPERAQVLPSLVWSGLRMIALGLLLYLGWILFSFK